MTAELARTIDFDKLVTTLSDPKADLAEALTELTTIPSAPADARKSAMPEKTLLQPAVQQAMTELPSLFGKVQPASRRLVNGKEQGRLGAERRAIDAILKALKGRKDEIAEIMGTHFDVLAENKGKATDTSPRDTKGHYLLATPGTPEIQEVPDSDECWVRQRQSDKTVPSLSKLEQALADGTITREEYLKVTKPVTGREWDEDTLRKMLVSEKDRATAQKILDLTSETTPGLNSIHLKKIK